MIKRLRQYYHDHPVRFILLGATVEMAFFVWLTATYKSKGIFAFACYWLIRYIIGKTW